MVCSRYVSSFSLILSFPPICINTLNRADEEWIDVHYIYIPVGNKSVAMDYST